jgi:serine phosphatase RsbU (regulator of sigma subunit)
MVLLSADEVVEEIMKSVHDFAGEAAQSDDLTLMVARRDFEESSLSSVVDV